MWFCCDGWNQSSCCWGHHITFMLSFFAVYFPTSRLSVTVFFVIDTGKGKDNGLASAFRVLVLSSWRESDCVGRRRKTCRKDFCEGKRFGRLLLLVRWYPGCSRGSLLEHIVRLYLIVHSFTSYIWHAQDPSLAIPCVGEGEKVMAPAWEHAEPFPGTVIPEQHVDFVPVLFFLPTCTGMVPFNSVGGGYYFICTICTIIQCGYVHLQPSQKKDIFWIRCESLNRDDGRQDKKNFLPRCRRWLTVHAAKRLQYKPKSYESRQTSIFPR